MDPDNRQVGSSELVLHQESRTQQHSYKTHLSSPEGNVKELQKDHSGKNDEIKTEK